MIVSQRWRDVADAAFLLEIVTKDQRTCFRVIPIPLVLGRPPFVDLPGRRRSVQANRAPHQSCPLGYNEVRRGEVIRREKSDQAHAAASASAGGSRNQGGDIEPA